MQLAPSTLCISMKSISARLLPLATRRAPAPCRSSARFAIEARCSSSQQQRPLHTRLSTTSEGPGPLSSRSHVLKPLASRLNSVASTSALAAASMPADEPALTPAPTVDGESNQLSITEAVARAALHLKTHGWAVVPDVISREECEAYIDCVWGWLEGLGTGIQRNDANTWDDTRWPPKFLDSGIINRLEVAHQDFVWRMRADPRITSIFAALWGTLEVKEGSHAAHDEFWSEVSTMSADEKAATGDWYLFKPEELGFWDRFATKALRGQGPGSLFLWDSRTVHQNRPASDPSLWRHVLYTCYQPAALATEADLTAKQRAYEGYHITTHWPAQNVTVGAPVSEEEAAKYTLPRTRDQVESNTILRLAGVKPYDPTTERRAKPLVDASESELQRLLAAHDVRKVAQLAEHARHLAIHSARGAQAES